MQFVMRVRCLLIFALLLIYGRISSQEIIKQNDSIYFVIKHYEFNSAEEDSLISKVDSVELYTSYLDFYPDFEDEAYSLCAISEGLTNMNEINLTIGHTDKEILRYTYFSFSTPISVTIVKEQDSIIMTQRAFYGEFIFPESEKFCKVEKISAKKWSKLYAEFETVTNFKPDNKFNFMGPDLLMEMKDHDSYSGFYIDRSETYYFEALRKSVKNIEKLLGL